jgi:hypothetical protein
LPSPWAAPPSPVVRQSFGVGFGTGEEEKIHGNSQAAICGGDPRVTRHRCTHISIGPRRRHKPWGGFRSLALALETIMMECGGALGMSSGGGTMHMTEGNALGVCSTNGLKGDNDEHDAGSGGILAVGEGDCTLHTDDDSDALHTDGGSNVPSGGNDATVSEGTGRNDILAAGEGDGALHGDDDSATLHTDNGNDMSSRGGGLDAHIPGGDLVVGGALNAGYRRTCGLGRGILAGGDDSLGEGGRQPRRGWVRCTRPQRRPNVSGQHGWLYRRPRWGRPDNDTGGLDTLASGGLEGASRSSTLLATQHIG